MVSVIIWVGGMLIMIKKQPFLRKVYIEARFAIIAC